jgi:predicted RNase H-like nuclease
MTVALGVDVSAERGLDLVFIDERRRLSGPPLRRQTAEDLFRHLVERSPDVVAIDSPPRLAANGRSRLCERELLRLGLHCYFTPSDATKAKNPFYDWMRAGFAAFAAAARARYRTFGGDGIMRRRALEVFPHATAVALAGCLPPRGTCRSGSDKRRWRARALESAGIDTTELRTTDAIDAALAALTGLHALEESYWAVGDRSDGFIVVAGHHPTTRFAQSFRSTASPAE